MTRFRGLALALPFAGPWEIRFLVAVRLTRDRTVEGADATLDGWGPHCDDDDDVDGAGCARPVDSPDRRRPHRAAEGEHGSEPRPESRLRDAGTHGLDGRLGLVTGSADETLRDLQLPA